MNSVKISNRGNKEELRKNLAQLIRANCIYFQYKYTVLPN